MLATQRQNPRQPPSTPYASRTHTAHQASRFGQVEWPKSAVRGGCEAAYRALRDLIVGKGYTDGGCPLDLARKTVEAACYGGHSVNRRTIDRRMAQLRATGLIVTHRVEKDAGGTAILVDLDEKTWEANYGRDRHRRFFEGRDVAKLAAQQTRREVARANRLAEGTYRAPGRPLKMPGLRSLAAPLEHLAAQLAPPLGRPLAPRAAPANGQTCPSPFSYNASKRPLEAFGSILETVKPPIPQVLEPRDPPTPMAKPSAPRPAPAPRPQDDGMESPVKKPEGSQGKARPADVCGKPGFKQPPINRVERALRAAKVIGTGGSERFIFGRAEHEQNAFGTMSPRLFCGERLFKAILDRCSSWRNFVTTSTEKQVGLATQASDDLEREDEAKFGPAVKVNAVPERRERPIGPMAGGETVASKAQIQWLIKARFGPDVFFPVDRMTGLQRTVKQVEFCLHKTLGLLSKGKINSRASVGSYAYRILESLEP